MPPGQQQQRPTCNPAEVLLKLVLLATQSHFDTPGILDEKRMSTILLMGKKVMERSQRDAEARWVGAPCTPRSSALQTWISRPNRWDTVTIQLLFSPCFALLFLSFPCHCGVRANDAWV